MIVVGGWPGRNVVGLNGAFGVRPAAFAVGGSFDNPLLNDVDAGDSTTEFVLVAASLPSSGTATLNDDGGYSLVGAADGTHTTTATLYTWAQGGPLTQHATPEQIVTTVGAGGSTFTVSPSGLPSSLAYGTPAFTRLAEFSVALAGLASTISYGAPSFEFSGPVTFSVDLAGLASSLQYGTPSAAFTWVEPMLIVEDGTGKPDAESYASVAEADAYHAARGATAWAALSGADKAIKLRLATDYMQQRYGGKWKGYRATDVQALDWPRFGVVVDRVTLASDSVPVQVRRACCELALKATAQALIVDEAAQVKSESVGPLSVTYADGARQQTRFAAVEAMLAPLLAYSSGFGSIKVTRA